MGRVQKKQETYGTNVKLQKVFYPNVYCTGVAITVTSMTDIVVFAVGSSTVSSIHFYEKKTRRQKDFYHQFRLKNVEFSSYFLDPPPIPKCSLISKNL